MRPPVLSLIILAARYSPISLLIPSLSAPITALYKLGFYAFQFGRCFVRHPVRSRYFVQRKHFSSIHLACEILPIAQARIKFPTHPSTILIQRPLWKADRAVASTHTSPYNPAKIRCCIPLTLIYFSKSGTMNGSKSERLSKTRSLRWGLIGSMKSAPSVPAIQLSERLVMALRFLHGGDWYEGSPMNRM